MYTIRIIIIIVIIPLDAIGYINCFCEKMFSLFSSTLLFISSNFVICLALFRVVSNFVRYRCPVLLFFGRVKVLCLTRVSRFLYLFRILPPSTVLSYPELSICTYPLALFYPYFLLLFFVRVVRHSLLLSVGRRQSNITTSEVGLA